MKAKKLHTQKVTISKRRRDNKKTSDVMNKGTKPNALQNIFNTYYKDQVKALYRAVSGYK